MKDVTTRISKELYDVLVGIKRDRELPSLIFSSKVVADEWKNRKMDKKVKHEAFSFKI
jgi:hypothetical protein